MALTTTINLVRCYAATSPLGAQVVDVITAAKIDLSAGETLDGIGGFHCYGLTENSDVVMTENYLPMSLAEGCVLKRDAAKDQIITYDDVTVPQGRLCDRLREEQKRTLALPPKRLPSPHIAPGRYEV